MFPKFVKNALLLCLLPATLGVGATAISQVGGIDR